MRCPGDPCVEGSRYGNMGDRDLGRVGDDHDERCERAQGVDIGEAIGSGGHGGAW
jgi:hypothetical protein